MSNKKSFGSIIEKPNGTLYVKYIERYETTTDGKKKAIYKVESTHSTSRRIAQKRLDELEKAFRADSEQERIENLKKYAQEIQAGIDADRPKTPLECMFDKFLEVCRNKSIENEITDSSKRVYKSLTKAFVAYMRETKKVLFVEDVTTEMVKDYLAARKGELGEGRFKQTYNVGSHIYDLFVDAKMMLENPFKGVQIKFGHAPEQKRDSLTQDEVKQVLDLPKKDRLQFLVVCSLTTGMRAIDCCYVRWNDINLEDGTIQTHSIKTQKYNADKMIRCPIHPLLMAEIEKALKVKKADDEFVYSANVEDFEKKTIHTKLNHIFHKLGLTEKKKTFHSLRHTFVSTLINNGTPIPVVERLVGHSSVKMSMAYFHENQSVIDGAIKAMPDYSQAKGEDIEVVRLPKSLIASIRAKGKEGESLEDTLQRIVDGYYESQHHKFDNAVEGLIAEVKAKIAE